MKKFFGILLILGMLTLLSVQGFAASAETERLIKVTGDAEVKVAPDQAVLTFRVETIDKDLTIAKRQNDEKVRKILSLAPIYKIEPKDVQTDQISIRPQYKEKNGVTEFTGYLVTKNIIITVDDISKFENLLSDTLMAGANYFIGVQLGTTELRKYRDQARKLAIIAAREKAMALAGELGQKVGKPVLIVEEPTGWSSSNNNYQNISYGYANSSFSEGSTVSFGQITIRASVSVSFELE